MKIPPRLRRSSLGFFLQVAMSCAILPLALQAAPLQLTDPLQLFTDDYLIDSLSGGAKRVLQKPVAKEVVLTFDKAWEGSSSNYITLFQDGDIYRMYYRGARFTDANGDILPKNQQRQYCCMATSTDGINFSMKVQPATNGASYQLTVNSGTGDGTYAAGAPVTITADVASAGKKFDVRPSRRASDSGCTWRIVSTERL